MENRAYTLNLNLAQLKRLRRPFMQCLYFIYARKFQARKCRFPLTRNFPCVNKVDTLKRRSRLYVKVEPRSTFTFARGLSAAGIKYRSLVFHRSEYRSP